MAQGVAGIDIREIDLSLYVPTGSNAIFGVVGPSSKGDVDSLETFTDEGNFVNNRGRPVNRHHSVRAGIRYLRNGNQLKHVRIAGTLLATAALTLRNATADKDILTFSAKSPGTWANGNLQIAIVHNGSPATSYDVYVYFYGVRVDGGAYINVTNATVETIMANDPYVDVALDSDAGTDFPDETKDSVTEQLVPESLTDGEDGAFASTRSDDSSTGGIGEQLAYSNEVLFAGTAALAYSGSVGMAVSPGSFIITSPGPVVWTDDGEGNLASAGPDAGFIDYATGDYILFFTAVPVGNITASWLRGWAETADTAVAATLSYSGTASRPGVYPGAGAGANKVLFTHVLATPAAGAGTGAQVAYPALFGGKVYVSDEIEIQATIAAVVVTFTWDGTLTSAGLMNLVGDTGGYTATVDPSNGDTTFSAAPDAATNIDVEARYPAWDDGTGTLTGYNVASGSIDYQTGAWSVTFTAQPTVGTTMGLYYEHCTVLGTGTGGITDFSGTLDEYPVRPGSVYVTDGTENFTDNGDGTLTGSLGGSGTVDYWTGAVAVSFNAAPAAGAEVVVESARILADVTCILPGPIGNERTITGGSLTDGLYCILDAGSVSGLRFRVMFNGSAVETYDNVADLATLITTVNGASEYVNLESAVTTSEPDVTAAQNIGMAGAFTNSDVVGAKVGATYTGLQLFANPDIVPCHFITTPGIFHRQVQSAGIALCESPGRRCIWIHSLPDFTPPDQMTEDLPGVNSADPIADMVDYHNGNYTASAKVPYPPLSAWNTSFSAVFGTWVNYYDQYTDTDVWEPPEGDIGALAAYTDNNAYAWYPIAGEKRGGIRDINTIRYSPDKGERKIMCPVTTTGTPNCINPLVRFEGRGIFLYGQRTTQRTPTALDRINVRWMLNVVENQIDVVSRVFPFEINDDVLWAQIEDTVKSIVDPVAELRGMTGVRVVCDETTTTPDEISQYRVVCKVFIQPALAAEELEYQMVLTPQGVDFDAVAPVG